MKIAPTCARNNEKKKPLLPLIEEIETELSAADTHVFNLRADPTDADSDKCKVTVRVINGTEEPRTLLVWMRQAQTVCEGLNVTTWANRRRILHLMMKGTAKSIFDEAVARLAQAAMTAAAWAAADAANGGRNGAAGQAACAQEVALGVARHRHVDHLEESIKQMLAQILPAKILQRSKRYIRRECRKKHDLKVRTYYQRLLALNDELGLLPPYGGAAQRLSGDEMLDIILFGTPKSWQKEMDRQGFDPMEKTIQEVVDFMEQIETSEDTEIHTKDDDGDKKPAAKKKKGTSSKSKTSSSNGKKNCMLHGWGNHSTEECHAIKAQVAKMDNGDSKAVAKSHNKTWSRKAEEEKTKTQKDLNAFIQKALDSGIRKGIAAASKKRKSKGLDLNAFEDLDDGELKEFNYEEMDNLKIDSEDEMSEISV